MSFLSSFFLFFFSSFSFLFLFFFWLNLLHLFRLGTWTWTLSAITSGIPILGLVGGSYSNEFLTCIPSPPSSPTLTGPARFSQFNTDSVNFTWIDSHSGVDSCSSFISSSYLTETYTYGLYTSGTPTFGSSPSATTTVSPTGITSFSSLETGFLPGFVYWMVSVTKTLKSGSTLKASLTQTSTTSVLSVCVSSAPNVPVLVSPANRTVFGRCDQTANMIWNALSYSNFGTDCSTNPTSGLSIFLGVAPGNLTDFQDVLITQSSTGLFSINGFLPNTVYYWQLVASNSQLSTGSAIFSFTTPDVSQPECSGHGTCSLQGTCDCASGYTGSNCGTVVTNTPTPNPSAASSAPVNVGAIVGPVVGCLVLVVLVVLVLVFFVRRKGDKEPEKPGRPAPDFIPLAFTVPLGFPPLAQDKIVPWYSFEQLLVDNSFAFALSILDITQATEIDDVVKCMVYIMEAHKQGGNFVKVLITKDLHEKSQAGSLSAATLFRDNTFASKAFKTYAKIVGLPYLFHIFGDAVNEICQSELDDDPKADTRSKASSMRKTSASIKGRDGEVELQQVVVRVTPSGQNPLFDIGSFELDPTKMTDDEDGLVNAIFLQLKCQKLLIKLFRSSTIFPAHLKDTFAHLMSEVEQRLSREDGHKAIAAFLFLRLVNPAIIFPNQYGLVDSAPSSPALTRQLILITKVLQNLANGVTFGEKEPHMVPLNDVIDSNKNQLRTFVDRVSTQNPDQDLNNSPASNLLSIFLLPLQRFVS